MYAALLTGVHSEASPLFELTAGFIVFCFAVHSILSGRAWVRFGGWVYRTKEPKTFWWNVSILFLIALFLIGRCLVRVSGT